MAAILDRCRFNPTAGGTSDWTYASAVLGFMSPALAGAVNGKTYKYAAESADFTQWEIGEGTYTTATGVLTRTTVLYNSLGTGTATGQSGIGAKISFSATPQVMIVALKEDVPSVTETNSLSGVLNFTNTTVATAYNNGALVIGGGVGIAGALYCNGAGSFASLATVANFTVGAGGTGITPAITVINGGSGAASGAVLRMQKNSVNKWHLAPASYSLGSGTSDDHTLWNYGTSTIAISVSFSTNVTTVVGLVAQTGGILSQGAIGYITGLGAGSAVTQLTSRTTGVTANTPTGAITLFSAAGSATPASFVVTNSSVAATDIVRLSVKSASNVYATFVTAVAAGSFTISFYALSGTATDAPVFNFAVIKGSAN